jgi:hypothetical protein
MDTDDRYFLASTPAVYTPGIIRWLRNMAQTDADHANALLRSVYPTAPDWLYAKVMAGEYTVEGEDVVVAP